MGARQQGYHLAIRWGSRNTPRVRTSAGICCIRVRFRGLRSSRRMRQLLHVRKKSLTIAEVMLQKLYMGLPTLILAAQQLHHA